MNIVLDPDSIDAILALSVASGLTPSAVVRKLLDPTAPPARESRQPRRPRRWPVFAGAAAASLLLLVATARRARRTP